MRFKINRLLHSNARHGAESLKTLFEKPISGNADEVKVSDNGKIVINDSLDQFVEMPPGSVEQTVRTLEEQGLSKSVKGIKENPVHEDISVGKINLPGDVDSGKQISKQNLCLKKQINKSEVQLIIG